MKFTKHDDNKSRLDLVPPVALDAVGDVLAHGAQKYSPNNWRKVQSRSRYLAAAMRHINAYAAGHDLDGDSDLPTLAHAVCSLLFLLECDLENLGIDDRPNKRTATNDAASVD